MKRNKLEKKAYFRLKLIEMALENASQDELEFLVANLARLVSFLDHSTDVEKNYEFYTEVKKLIRKK